VLESGMINSYQFKGSAMFQVNEALKTIDTNNYKVEYDGVENKKKGSISYSVPLFKQGKEITKEERNEAIENVAILKEYFN
jgi:IMP dehydrogenase/GMP reductase